jgi:tetratricopeptide (TPR) repeat protein
MRFAVVVGVIAALRLDALAAPTAEDLFNEGQTAYNHGDYTVAIDRWQRSYRLSKEAALLFNIAQAYRLEADCEHALSTYKQFIAIDPTSEQRPRADEFIRELEPKCGTPPRLHVDPVPPEVENSRSGHTLKLAGLVAGGTGAALLAGGLLLGQHASTLGDEVTTACAVSCDWSAQRDKDAAGRRDATLGRIFDGVGLAAIAAGVTVYVLGDRRSEPQLVVRPTPGGAAVTWSGTW